MLKIFCVEDYENKFAKYSAGSHLIDYISSMKEIGIISETSRKVDFEWKIVDIFSYTEENAEFFSPKFHVLNSEWEMSVLPNGEASNDSTGFVSLYLRNVNGKTPASVDFMFGIKTVNNSVDNVKKASWESTDAAWGFLKFIKRSELEQKKENLAPSGNFTIICSLTVKDNGQNFENDGSLNKLSEKLAELCISKKDSDVSLKINDETILVHKSILSARSPVFCAMFENEMTEKKTGVVNISDCDQKVLNIFLLYLYSGKIDFKDCDVFDLYKIADKYDVPELKLRCIDFMICSLSIENVCETFIFSHAFEEEKLQSFIHHFFCENFRKIVSSDSWKSLLELNCKLANDLLIQMAPKVKMAW